MHKQLFGPLKIPYLCLEANKIPRVFPAEIPVKKSPQVTITVDILLPLGPQSAQFERCKWGDMFVSWES